MNPLTIAENKTGKQRLVLDCRHLNKHLFQFKFKYENSEVAMVLFEEGDFMFSFDLKSAYHHIMIANDFITYLGFQWKDKFYVFNVLPFGLATAGFIFSKVTREVVKHWRSMSYKVVMYLDDGLAGAETHEKAKLLSQAVKADLISLGFVIAEEKCLWEPVHEIVWLGLVWDMKEGILRLTEGRLNKLLSYIQNLLTHLRNVGRGVGVRFLAAIVGQLISAQCVFGSTVRLRTRFTYHCVNEKTSWKAPVYVTHDAENEMKFWLENAIKMNQDGNKFRHLTEVEVADIKMYCDASSVGFGGYLVSGAEQLLGDTGMYDSWSEGEMSQSSTWRELEAVHKVFCHNIDKVKGKSVKVFTDNKNVKHILKVGSKKTVLNKINKEIISLCDDNDVQIQSEWIPRSLNTQADHLIEQTD